MTHEASKQAERTTRHSAGFLLAAIDAVPDVLLVTDRQHRVALANQAARDAGREKQP